MPEQPDPVTDRLARFTPNASGLDRDALLFAAGQRSARGSRLWPAAAALLAVSQVVTLIALWPSEPVQSPVVAPIPTNSPPPEPITPATPPSSEVWTVRSDPDVLTSPAPATGEYVSTGRPLTAGSAFRFD
ncbi:MAG TPA: hypothetical protein VKD71_11050 [Gemmataceae bacterium]|nr:hypothetical protein [Gemmataceae bacterium]